MKLSDHFDSGEFRCHCGCGDASVTPRLIDALEDLRAIVGRPVKILSGKRCQVRNQKVGGAIDSRHLTGEAADIVVPEVLLTDLWRAAMAVPQFQGGGAGIYPDGGFLHLDVREGRARWGFMERRYVDFARAWDWAKRLEAAA